MIGKVGSSQVKTVNVVMRDGIKWEFINHTKKKEMKIFLMYEIVPMCKKIKPSDVL